LEDWKGLLCAFAEIELFPIVLYMVESSGSGCSGSGFHLLRCLISEASRSESEVQPLVAFVGSSFDIVLLLVVAHCAPDTVAVATK
jgi:hypothetical protein